MERGSGGRTQDPSPLARGDEVAHAGHGDARRHRSRSRLHAAADRRRSSRRSASAAPPGCSRSSTACGRAATSTSTTSRGWCPGSRPRPISASISTRRSAAEPRAFKSHLPWMAVPKGARYIVSLRDPRDALVSMYRFMEGWFFEPGTDRHRGVRARPLHEAGRRHGLLDAPALVVGAARQSRRAAPHLRADEDRPGAGGAPHRERSSASLSTRLSRRSCSSRHRCSR